jgi:A/G-specific adenine glycosylase
MSEPSSSLTDSLLDWYDAHARALPWRVLPHERVAGVRPDPYHVWLSEIMAQQTTLKAVIPYYERFLQLWPSVFDLAQASQDEINAAWAGLGYYRRAANLKKCAQKVVSDYQGQFPASASALKALPGIGDYTSAAIAAICFEAPVAVVDGNVERVFARLYCLEKPPSAMKNDVKEKVEAHVSAQRAGDFAQGLMDLGATICTPKNPACALCPIHGHCQAFKKGVVAQYPIAKPRKAQPLRKGIVYVIRRNGDGAVLLRKRPDKGLLAGLSEFPSSHWSAQQNDMMMAPPVACAWEMGGTVSHVFTHFKLTLEVRQAWVDADILAPQGMWWALPEELSGQGLPGLMQKVWEEAW